jgi:protein Mpv17
MSPSIPSLLFLFSLSSSSVWAADAFIGSSFLAKPTLKVMSKPACCVPTSTTRHYSLQSFPPLLLRGGQQGEMMDVMNTRSSEEEKPSPPTVGILASAVVLAPLSSLASLYAHQLRTRPIQTKSVTAGIIFGLSDYFAQTIEIGKSDDESKAIVQSRILTTFLVGLMIFGPAANSWYYTMFKFWPSTALLPTLIKAFLGRLLFGPAFTAIFFAAGMIQSGTFSFTGWISKINKDLPKVAASGAGFWMPVSFVSYKFIPMQWIPLFTNVCSFVWTIYLSLVSNRKPKQ